MKTHKEAQQAAHDLQKYFKTCLMKGDYDVESYDDNGVNLSVAGLPFRLLIGHDCERAFFGSIAKSFMQIDLTSNDEEHLYRLTANGHKAWIRDNAIAVKQAELDKLKLTSRL
jgi:hypothetical protein